MAPKSLPRVLLLLALVTGCGNGRPPAPRCPPGADCNWPPQNISDGYYAIEAGASAPVDQVGVFVITANGQGDWYLGWQGDQSARPLYGTVATPLGLQFLDVHYLDATLGDTLTNRSVGKVDFAASMDHAQHQILSISVDAASEADVPLSFNLGIDGQNALTPLTLWPIEGRLEGPTTMPFQLETVSTGILGRGQTDLTRRASQDTSPQASLQPAPPPRRTAGADR